MSGLSTLGSSYLRILRSPQAPTDSATVRGRVAKGRGNPPVNPQASAKRKVLHDIRKKRAVSSRGKQCSLVNLVTSAPVKELSPATSIRVTENHTLLAQDPSLRATLSLQLFLWGPRAAAWFLK